MPLAIGAVLVAVGVVAIRVFDPPRAPDTGLSELPEASLAYPGSMFIRGGSRDATSEAPAAVSQQYGSDASVEEILAFYTAEMTHRGFATGADGSITRSLEEFRVCGWHRDDVVVRVSWWDIGRYAQMVPDAARFSTVYEVRLLRRKADPTVQLLCTDAPPHRSLAPLPNSS